MKKFLFFMILGATSLLFPAKTSAQNALINVERIGWYDAEYPIITWGGVIGGSIDVVKYINNLVDDNAGENKSTTFKATDETAYFGSRVERIDGIDAKGMNSAKFNSLMAEPRSHTLLLNHPAKGRFEVHTECDIPIWMQAYGFHPLYAKWTTETTKVPENIKIRMDENAPWRTFRTYDFLILSDDVLTDKELLEKIGRKYNAMGLTRDPQNPDLLITISKDADKSVEYTYVPETVEHVQTGTNSYAMYGLYGKYLGNFSTNKYQTVKSGGYTHKTSTTNVYLEVSVLEASRMGERTIPMIYQMKYSYNTNSDLDVDKLYSNAVSWIEHPLYGSYSLKHTSSTECSRFFWKNLPLVNFGIIVNADNKVVGLDSNSNVVQSSGLRKGDRIISINSTRRKPFSGGEYKATWSGTITVERNGSTLTLKFKNCRRTNQYALQCYTYSYFGYK
ncbi:MAG: hypothetical protein E7076_00430 [Bacteroidales bacterium]|nr:hypothetical protein [Bacteroidales bacterium]